MADSVTFKIEGAEALNARLKTVSDDVKYKGGRFALRKAAQVIREGAKDNAKRLDDPQTAADISANIVERWSGRTFKRTGNLMFRVGVMGGAGGSLTSEKLRGNPGGDTRHWRYLEFGTENISATPFMRPAITKNLQAITGKFVSEYNRALDRALRRAKK